MFEHVLNGCDYLILSETFFYHIIVDLFIYVNVKPLKCALTDDSLTFLSAAKALQCVHSKEEMFLCKSVCLPLVILIIL